LKTSALKFGEELIIIDLRGIGSEKELIVSIFLLFYAKLYSTGI